MNVRLFLICLYLVSSSNLEAQPGCASIQMSQRQGSGRTLNPDSLLRDFTILVTTLKENHPLMDAYLSRARFDSLSQEIEFEIREGITWLQFYKSVSRFLARSGCGHTRVSASTVAATDLQMHLPFDVMIAGDSVCISQAHDPGFEKFAGQRIRSINKIPASEIRELAEELISADGYNATYRHFQFAKKFGYYVNLVLNKPDSLVFEMEGEYFEVTPGRYPRTRRNEAEPGFRDLSGKGGAVLLSLSDFDSGRRQIRKCFRYIEKNHVESLVIDLRNNEGGNGNVGAYLASLLVDSATTYYLDKRVNPFQYKNYVHRKDGMIISNQFILNGSVKSYYFKVRSGQKHHFSGKLYVLINGGTFSTAAYVASILKYKTHATFVGEESGGNEYGIGGGTIAGLALPYSGMEIEFPVYHWRFNATGNRSGTGVIPDVKIVKAHADTNTKKDLQLDAVLEMINQIH